MSLRNRVALAGGAVVFVMLLVTALVLYPVMDARRHAQSDAELVSAAEQVPGLARPSDTGEAQAAEPSQDGAKPASPAQSMQLGRARADYLESPAAGQENPDRLPVTAADLEVARGERPAGFRDQAHGGVTYRVYSAPVPDVPGALVRASLPQSAVTDGLTQLRTALIVAVLGGTLLTALGARLAAGRVLRPVRRLTETVENVAATHDLTATVEAHGRDEIGRLARAFATMMTELDASDQVQKRLVADASHELRTPLTSLTTNLELLDEGPGLSDPLAPVLVSDARRQAAELVALVNDLIDLGRYGQTHHHTEDTRLDELARRVVDRAAPRARGLTFRTDLSPCLVHVDPDAVERAIANLVNNAIKWSPPNGEIHVRVTATGTLSVTDEGPGIARSDLPYIFDRFYRSPAARSRPGSGLGLAIVRQIAETHGGASHAERLPRGTRVHLKLPTLGPMSGALPPNPPPTPWQAWGDPSASNAGGAL